MKKMIQAGIATRKAFWNMITSVALWSTKMINIVIENISEGDFACASKSFFHIL